MGKIVKYCSSCDEGFGEKFSFCPDCGGPLQAFAMSPVEAAVAEQAPPAPEFIEPAISERAAVEMEPTVPEFEDTIQATAAFEPAVEETVEVAEEPVTHTEISATEPYFQVPAAVYADEPRAYAGTGSISHAGDEDFHVTVIEETNGKQRNLLLFGAAAFMLSLSLGAWGVSLFSKDLDVGAIGGDSALARLIDEVPSVVEEEPKPEKKDKGGGGGGGGREEEREVNQGDLADQSPKPTRPPDAHVFRSDNFELQTPPPQTQGNQKFEKKFEVWGDPNALSSIASNGTGRGGGQGSGFGTGQGSGSGSGAGSGSGSGYGNGNGNGNGDGTGDGSGGSGGPPPPATPKITSPLKILAKPKALFTDSARTNQTQGTVRLRVVLLASGAVGSITPLSRLPDGLTEQAIAAARQIRFEPEKVNGIARAKTVTLDYNFTLY